MTAVVTLAEQWQLALRYFKQGDTHRASRYCRNVLSARPNHVQALHMRGALAALDGRLDVAIDMHKRALTIEPTAKEIRRSLAREYMEAGHLAEAEQEYRTIAEGSDWPDNRDLSLFLIRTGKWREGWSKYECRIPHTDDDWDGNYFDGRIIVKPEMGLGDNLMMARFLPLVAKKCTEVVYQSPTGIKSLIDGRWSQVFTEPTGRELPERYCYIMSLPYLLKISQEGMADIQDNWIDCSPIRTGHDRLRVGVVWGGSPKYPRDVLRSMTNIKEVSMLLQADVDWYVLQQGPYRAMMEQFPKLVNETENVKTFKDTADVIQKLDLVVTVDTSVAHLSASMGVPTWVMISTAPEFRWPVTGDKSVWYPSVRLFRQTTYGKWWNTISAVHDALLALY